jgi:hypothetical protein
MGEVTQARERLRSFIRQFGDTRFSSPDSEQKPRDCAGCKRDGLRGVEFLIWPPIIRDEILKGLPYAASMRSLRDAGVIRCDEGRYTIKTSVPDLPGSHRVVYVVERGWSDAEDDDPNAGARDLKPDWLR